MKRLFTIVAAVMAMSLTFAQIPLAKESAGSGKAIRPGSGGVIKTAGKWAVGGSKATSPADAPSQPSVRRIAAQAENESYSTELVTLPEGAESTGWYLSGTSVRFSTGKTPFNNQNVNVAFFGNDVYIQGISTLFPTAWVRGTIEGTTVKFDKYQYIGKYGVSDCWFVGYDSHEDAIEDAIATYDSEAKTITFTDDVCVIPDYNVTNLDWVADIVISAEPSTEEPVITDRTAELSYRNTFETEEEQAQVAVYDANLDRMSFLFQQHPTGSTVAYYMRHSSNQADDYLVFPGVALKAGATYKISVDAASFSSSYRERLEIVAGKEAKLSQLTLSVIPDTYVSDENFKTLSNDGFTVEEDGTYFFAVHAISAARQYYLYVDNFSIADLLAPADITDLSVVADGGGANKAAISFTVPDRTIGGTGITGNADISIRRDGEEIFSGTKAAGESVATDDDEVPAAGYHTYSVRVSYAGHAGFAAETKVYVGYDRPDVVNNLTGTDRSGYVALAWEAPTGGAEGRIVNPADYTYNVYPVLVDVYGYKVDFEHPLATGLTETSANVEYDTNSGEHGYTFFAVTAENTTGESEAELVGVLTGAPYELPLIESLAKGYTSYWWDYTSEPWYMGGYGIDTNASDDDGYCFITLTRMAGWAELQSGKIALAGAANPVLMFDYADGEAAPALTVYAATPDETKELATFTPGDDYATAEVSLAEFASEDWVRIYIRGTFAAEGYAYIDNIRVYNKLDNDLMGWNITAKPSVLACDDVTVTATVKSFGNNSVAAGAYTVDLYRNDVKVQTLEGTELDSFGTATFTFTETTDAMTPAELTWKAVVEFAADEDTGNNTTATVKTTVKPNHYPAVSDLAGARTDNGVSLTWSAPDLSANQTTVVTDDFESYEGFTTSAGDWTFVDVDKSPVGDLSDIEVDGVSLYGSLQSFWVYYDATGWPDNLKAHSGTKYLSAIWRLDYGQVDDWAISPMLSGNAQTISLYARSLDSTYPEKIEILYSTGSTAPADFISVKEATEVPEAWTEIRAELPEGAMRFAIRSCADDNYFLMVDDVTYETTEFPTDLVITGYNIYRDSVRLNAEPVAEPAYTDAGATEDGHSYVVTVVYNRGESAVSNVVNIAATGIESIAVRAAKVSTGRQSITIEDAEGQAVSIYTADGKTVYKAAGQSRTSVRVESGVYIVKVGKTTLKAVVK